MICMLLRLFRRSILISFFPPVYLIQIVLSATFFSSIVFIKTSPYDTYHALKIYKIDLNIYQYITALLLYVIYMSSKLLSCIHESGEYRIVSFRNITQLLLILCLYYYCLVIISVLFS